MGTKVLFNAALVSLIFFFQLFVIGVCAMAVSFDESQYDSLFQELGVYDQFGKAAARDANHAVVSYLKGETETVESDFFNGREKGHLQDVKGIFQWMKIVAVSFLALFAFALWLAKEKLKLAGTILFGGGIILLGILGILALALNLDFSGPFAAFHELFFPQGNYLFDPATENIVNLYPEQLFFALALRISLLSGIIALLFVLGGYCLKKGS